MNNSLFNSILIYSNTFTFTVVIIIIIMYLFIYFAPGVKAAFKQLKQN